MRTKSFLIGAALVLSSVIGFTQEATHEAGHAEAVNDGCVLSTATNGQTITVHGKVMSEPHDMAFGIPGCNDTVLLTYAGDRDNDVSVDQLRKDENLKQFQNYTSAVYKSKGKSLCLQCMKYGDVEATLTGKLQVATMPPGTTKDPAGFLRDSTGKIVGTFGWGHPVPFAKYRLIIQSVSDVKARKLPKPTPPSKTAAEAEHKSSANNGSQQQPVVMHADLPLYPPIARAARISGTVQVQVTVKDGAVVNTEVKSRANPLLVVPTLANLKTWQFWPKTDAAFLVTYIYTVEKKESDTVENPRIEMQLPNLVKITTRPVKPTVSYEVAAVEETETVDPKTGNLHLTIPIVFSKPKQ